MNTFLKEGEKKLKDLNVHAQSEDLGMWESK